MVTLTFPDGARREYPQGITGLEIAKGISPSLAKRTVAMALDGTVADLSDKIERDAKIVFLTREDPPSLDLVRPGRQCVQADAGRRRVLARRFQEPDADPHLRHRLGEAGRPRHAPEESRRGGEARPSPARP